MHTRDKAKKICDKVLKLAKGKAEVVVHSRDGALTRFAKNCIIQNVASKTDSISVRVHIGNRIGSSSTNKTDDASLKAAVERATQAAGAASPTKGLPPMLGPQKYGKTANYCAATAKLGPEDRAEAVRYITEKCKRAKVECSGVFSNASVAYAMANSKGLFAYDASSDAEFGATVLTATSEGGTGRSHRDHRIIDTRKLSDIAFDKAISGQKPKDIPAGEYTVILEPAAITNLISFLRCGFSGRMFHEGTSFLTGRLGKKLFGSNITITDDADNPEIGGMPFDMEGTPRRDTVLVENGVVKTLLYDRRTAREHKKQPTGHALPQPSSIGAIPFNAAVSGGDSSLEEMIASTKKGLLVTNFHYNNIAERREVVLTGMTRDGLFLIENGRIKHPVKNMRYTQSVIEAFNNVEAISKERLLAKAFFGGSFVVPAMKINGFNFSSETKF